MVSETPEGSEFSTWLTLAVEAMEEAAAMFGLSDMVAGGTCEPPQNDPGAFVWMSGQDHTLLMGVQCADVLAVGTLLGEEEEQLAQEAGTDIVGELLNIVAGVVKGKAEEAESELALGLPVFAPGSISPRVVRSTQAMRVNFGELAFTISLIEMTLSPEARKRREEAAKNERLKAELQLAQKLEAVGQLAAGVAHEINTPLQYISDNLNFLVDAFDDLKGLVDNLEGVEQKLEGNAETAPLADQIRGLKSDADVEFLDESVPTSLQTLRKGIEQVSTVVQALKSVGSAGMQDRRKVNVNEVIENTLVVTNNCYEAFADLETDLGKLPEIEADPGQIGQVFIQLVVNAAEAIESSLDPNDEGARGHLAVTSYHDGDHVIIEVRDSGCGMSEEVRDKIFNPFFTTKGEGVKGQGLSTVRSILVEGHGGTIEVESEVGKGTSFTVRLPVRTAAKQASAA